MLRLHSQDFSASTMVFPSVLTSDGQLPDWESIKYEKMIQEVRLLDGEHSYAGNECLGLNAIRPPDML